MVWIQGSKGEYINLDQVEVIYVRDLRPYSIIASLRVDSPEYDIKIMEGNDNKEESHKVLDELMRKVN